MTGYQQGILLALGSNNGNRLAVRSIDPWFPNSVADLFIGNSVYQIMPAGRNIPQYCIKSPRVRLPALDDVSDWPGFCRAWFEIHGCVRPITYHNGKRIFHRPGITIYGPDYILDAIQSHIPINPKRIQSIVNSVDGGKYTGHTSSITIRFREFPGVLDYIDGIPRNESVWCLWQEKITRINQMDNKGDVK